MAIADCTVARTCGGCPLLALSPEEERTLKVTSLRNALLRHWGQSECDHEIEWVALPSDKGYRHRIRLRIDETGRIGFFNPEKTAECGVLLPELRDALKTLLALTADNCEGFAELAHLELRAPDLDQKPAVFFTRRDALRPASDALLERLTALEPQFLWAIDDPRCPIPMQRHAIGELDHDVPLTSFLQINRAINDTILHDCVTYSKQLGISSFCDLYAGAGNFTLPLLAMGARGTAIEYDALAMQSCARSAERLGVDTPILLAGDATEGALKLSQAGKRFDLVIIDPPRAGAKSAIRTMAGLAEKAVLYCSCNTESLAKDIAQLLPLGYKVIRLRAYNMFAHTVHLETCVWLRAPQAKDR